MMKFLGQKIKELADTIFISPQKIEENQHSRSKFKEVLKDLALEDLHHFLWLSILKPGSLFDAYTLSILRTISLQEAEAVLQRLFEKNLITKENTQDHYRLYESLRVFAEHLLTANQSKTVSIPRLGIKWIDAHQRVVLSIQRNQNGFEFQKDIYFLKHLHWHLQEAQWETKIHSVISHLIPLNQWHQSLGSLVLDHDSNFENLLLLAESEVRSSLSKSTGERLQTLSKYMLMRTTQKLVLQSIPVQWVQCLVITKRWPVSQALRYILAQHDPNHQASAIEALHRFFSAEGLSQLLQHIHEIRLEPARVRAIVSIFHRLTTKEKKVVINQIKTIKTEAYQSLCICNIAKDIPLPLMQQTYLIIEQMEDQLEQSKALESFLEVSTRPFKKQCLTLINTYGDCHLKVRLFKQLCSDFPELKGEILRISEGLAWDYSAVSILWELLEPEQQSTTTLISWLQKDMSDLDKVLFLSERASEVRSEDIEEIWSLIQSPKQWAEITKATSFVEREANWGNAVLGCIHRLSPAQIQQLIPEISSLNSAEIKAELCLQLFPFFEPQAQYHQLYQIIESIQDLETRLKVLSQVIDYIPHTKIDILTSVERVNNTIAKLEIQSDLLERVPEIAPIFLQAIRELDNETDQFNFLHQTLDLVPEHELGTVIELIFQLENIDYRSALLNQLTHKLNPSEIEELIYCLSEKIYPHFKFQNAAKQIYRNYWESGLSKQPSNISDRLLLQLPKSKKTKATLTHEDLAEIISSLSANSQRKVLSLYLQEVQWQHLDADAMLLILEALSQGCPLEFIENFPTLTQGISEITGTQLLHSYGNLCEQLGYKSLRHPIKASNRQNIAHIYHKFERPEFLNKIA